MATLHNRKIQLQVYYTAVGKLPKIGGCYFSNRQSTTINKRIQQKQSKDLIDDRDLEKARKRLDFELKKNGYKKKHSMPVKTIKCKTQPHQQDITRKMIELELAEEKVREQALKMQRKRTSECNKKHFPHYLIRLKKPQKEHPNSVPSRLEKTEELITIEKTPRSVQKMVQKFKIKVNHFDIQALERKSIQIPKTVKTEENESKHINYQSQRVKQSFLSSPRHSLLQRIKKRYGNTTQIPVNQLKPTINQTVLFKRYREVEKEQRDIKSRTQHFKEQLKQYL